MVRRIEALVGAELVGATLMGAFAGLTLLSAAVVGGDPSGPLVVAATGVVAFLLGRIAGARDRGFLALLAAFAVVLVGVTGGADAVSGTPTAPPLDYGNANGALYGLGVFAAALASVSLRSRWLRVAAWVLGAALLALTVTTRSDAAAALAATVLVVTAVAARLPRRTVLVAPLLVLGCLTITVVVALVNGTTRSYLDTVGLSARRADLWHDALQLAAENPLLGVGPGEFATESATAAADADAGWAHSLFLQVAAETGIPALLVIIGMVLWAFTVFARANTPRPVAVVGAAGIAAFAVHTTIDYVASFPILVGLVAMLLGLASAPAPDAVVSRATVTPRDRNGSTSAADPGRVRDPISRPVPPPDQGRFMSWRGR